MDLLYFCLLILTLCFGTRMTLWQWPWKVLAFTAFPAALWLAYRSAFLDKVKWPDWLNLSKEPWYVAKIGGVKFNEEATCRGWEIDGKTGSGKTACAVIPLIHEFKKNRPNIGILSLDTKGDLSTPVQAIAHDLHCEEDLRQLIVRPDTASPEWTPVYTMNLIADPGIPHSTYAKLLVDVATAAGQKGGQAFFKNASQSAIQHTLDLLEALNLPCTIFNCHETVCNTSILEKKIKELKRFNSTRYDYLKQYFTEFAEQPPEQLSGVITSIANYLQPYVTPDIAQIFSDPNPTFHFKEIDRGKLISVKVPQKYQVERRYINLFLKCLYYLHALRRYDLPAGQLAAQNLIVMVIDEAQEAVLVSEDGLSDYNVVDKIRGARATTVNCTQSPTSYIPPMGTRPKADVFLLNLANKIYFTAADSHSADMLADALGKHTVKKVSRSFSSGKLTTNIAENDEHLVKAHKLQNLPKFSAIIKHCERPHKQVRLWPSPFTKPQPTPQQS